MSDVQLLTYNALVYTVIAIIQYMRKHRRITIGLVIAGFYSLIAWGAVLFRGHEFYGEFNDIHLKMTVVPLVYLIFAIATYAYPLFMLDNNKIDVVVMPKSDRLLQFVRIMVFLQIVLVIYMLPDLMHTLRDSDLGALRSEQYGDKAEMGSGIYVLTLLMRLYMGARNVIIVIAVFCAIFIKGHKLLKSMFLSLSFLFPLMISAISVSRDVMVMETLYGAFLLVLMSAFVSRICKRKILFGSSMLVFVVAVIFISISVSRFHELASYMFYRYLGEPMINFDNQLFYQATGTTDGTAYFTFFRKLLGMGNPPFSNTIEKWEYIESHTGVDAHIFYTFIGALNLEFGFVVPVIVGLVLSYVIIKYLQPYNVFTLPKFIVVGMLGYLLFTGGFYFVFQGEWGNLELLSTIFFVWLFTLWQGDERVWRIGYNNMEVENGLHN